MLVEVVGREEVWKRGGGFIYPSRKIKVAIA
jgi:hypothetical protein